MIKYGLISETDGRTLEKTMDLICKEFVGEVINITEIGIYSGETTKGICEYLESKGRGCFTIGIDNDRDGQEVLFSYYSRLIKGNSNEVYNQIPEESQHLIIQDANHSYQNAIQDFFCYMRKVKIGGYMWWHDTAVHVQGTGWQLMGSREDTDMAISVRKALTDIGLFDNKYEGWEFVMEDADLNDTGGGCAVFRRIK